MAIERVNDEGESPAIMVSACSGSTGRPVYKWIKAAIVSRVFGIVVSLDEGYGAATNPERSAQERAGVHAGSNGRDPRQYGLDFGLWTRAVVMSW